MITILIGIIIFYISSITFKPSLYLGEGISGIDIIYHISIFFFFSFFMLISIVKGKKEYIFIVLTVLISIIYGISDEMHQFFIMGRYTSIFDVFLNTIGITFAALIYSIRIEFFKKFAYRKF